MDDIEVNSANGVQTIRFNRPQKKNAITAEMYQTMADALDAANSDDEVRASVFLGHPSAFTAGNDILDFMAAAMNKDKNSNSVFEFLERIIMAKKPLVAGVDGFAIGVGTTMLMHCDYVVASKASKLHTPFVDLGLVPEAGSSLWAPQLMGHHKAFELLGLGVPFSAEQGAQAGLVNLVVEAGEAEKAAMEIANAIAAKPAKAMQISRDLIRGDRTAILERMREEAILFGERLNSDEARKAFSAFMQKSA